MMKLTRPSPSFPIQKIKDHRSSRSWEEKENLESCSEDNFMLIKDTTWKRNYKIHTVRVMGLAKEPYQEVHMWKYKCRKHQLIHSHEPNVWESRDKYMCMYIVHLEKNFPHKGAMVTKVISDGGGNTCMTWHVYILWLTNKGHCVRGRYKSHS